MTMIMPKMLFGICLKHVLIFILHSFVVFVLPTRGITLSAFHRDPTIIPLRAAISRDSRYAPWQNATAILYRMDPSYSTAEVGVIRQAMTQISQDMNNCIRFQPYTVGRDAGSDHIYIGKKLNNGISPPTCFSFPGRIITQAGQGQKLALFGTAATDGCMDTARDVMKFLVHVLGIRNEYNRPDRDQFINVFTANVKPELQSLNLLRVYTGNQVDYTNTLFDFNSVTIPAAQKYAKAGTFVYSPKTTGRTFGTLQRLSQGDCTGIALQYTGCNYAICQDPYSTNIINGSPVATTTTTTTAGATTTSTTTTTTVTPLNPNNPLTINPPPQTTVTGPTTTTTTTTTTPNPNVPVQPPGPVSDFVALQSTGNVVVSGQPIEPSGFSLSFK